MYIDTCQYYRHLFGIIFKFLYIQEVLETRYHTILWDTKRRTRRYYFASVTKYSFGYAHQDLSTNSNCRQVFYYNWLIISLVHTLHTYQEGTHLSPQIVSPCFYIPPVVYIYIYIGLPPRYSYQLHTIVLHAWFLMLLLFSIFFFLFIGLNSDLYIKFREN